MALLNVDYGKKQGEIRRLNGVNLAPRIKGRLHQEENRLFKALNAPVTRFHDAPLDNSGTRLVDPHLIFANFHADVDDVRNYYFKQTDDYFRNCRNLGTELHYRLGPSIEHYPEKYFIYPPEDYDKWIDICINIIRHYNEGWNNGFAWNIKYWTLWEEPENPLLWAGEPIQFFRLFKLAVSRIKERFPWIKLGTCIGNHLPPQWTADFLAYCRDEKVAMDFFAWSLYRGDLDEAIGYPARIRKLIDGYGFKDTELHIGEWNYTNRELDFFGPEANEHPEGRYGNDGAAFAGAVLTGWQDTPLTMANYYTASVLMGLIDRYAIPKKIYYGFLAFGEMTRYMNRVSAVSDTGDIKILAGTGDANEGAILVSAFKSPVTEIKIAVNGAETGKAEVLCVNGDLNMEPVSFETDGGGITLKKAPGSSVFLIRGLNCNS